MNRQPILIKPLAINGLLPEEKSLPAKRTEKKLFKELKHKTGEAILLYNMIEDGDKVMVCVSGGKDSYAMLELLLALQKKAPISFEIVAVNLDQKQPGFPEEILPAYLSSLSIDYHIIEQDTYSIVKEKTPEGKTTCGLCSRLRRGILYSFAEKIGATKIALGHHQNDIIETFFLNMFFNAKLKAMPPKLLSDNKKHVVIRPLALCKESDIAAYAEIKKYPIIPCNLCGSQKNLQRQVVKEMIRQWEQESPGRSEMILKSLQDIVPSHLADNEWYDFKSCQTVVNVDTK
ncbi:tRNA(Cytosine32)-2-thiocytidine synthetase [hydrothermal vent metagenome]|uniref:tRNA(Cytosine32)-2-thiocytidine synthetase n=1 Tax=hydrothermal vent metagenome TaxID=652676 RepID=A0A3B0WBS6_9ZZZZ